MRIASSVTSVSWVPSEAITGRLKVPFSLKVGHHDDPPPEVLADLDALLSADRFRFANVLRAWIEVEDGVLVDWGQEGGGVVATASLGAPSLTFPVVPYPDIRREPELGDGWVRFVQTTGGRMGVPMPRRVDRPPHIQFAAPTAWTTLGLRLHHDGRTDYELLDASPFPRHWVYDGDARVVLKTGFVDFRTWASSDFGDRSPWGDQDEDVRAELVETTLEREISLNIMRAGGRPDIRTVAPGTTVVEQGTHGDELFLVLDGVLVVEVDGDPVAEVASGAVLGDRAMLEDGLRTSTVRAVTPAKLAVASADRVDIAALAALSERETIAGPVVTPQMRWPPR